MVRDFCSHQLVGGEGDWWSGLYKNHGNLRHPPKDAPPRNKALLNLLRSCSGKTVVNNMLIRPYLLGSFLFFWGGSTSNSNDSSDSMNINTPWLPPDTCQVLRLLAKTTLQAGLLTTCKANYRGKNTAAHPHLF